MAIEVKLAEKWDRSWEKPLRDLVIQAGVKVERAFGVYTGPRRYEYDGLRILPVAEFLIDLRQGEVF